MAMVELVEVDLMMAAMEEESEEEVSAEVLEEVLMVVLKEMLMWVSVEVSGVVPGVVLEVVLVETLVQELMGESEVATVEWCTRQSMRLSMWRIMRRSVPTVCSNQIPCVRWSPPPSAPPPTGSNAPRPRCSSAAQ